jgi:ribonuclease BN (tRNA processing enzyme)
MLFTHAHLDHVMGFPLFAPVYRKSTRIAIHGCSFNFPSYREIIKGVMCSPFFPVDIDSVSSRLEFNNRSEETFTVGGITVRSIFLSHPNGGLGFRFEEGSSSFVFLTDNEPAFRHPGGRSPKDYAEFSAGADLLIHDAEFTERDYPANRSFGHSRFSDAANLAIQARVKRFGMFHHNRERTDAQVDAMVAASKKIIAKSTKRIQCFAVGNSFEITL